MNLAILQEINHWWMSGRVKPEFIEPVERRVMTDLIEAVPERQVLLIEGPRRTGKTSLMYQLIDHLLGRETNPRHILYVSLDDPLIGRDRFFETLADLIETHLAGERLDRFKGTFYLFLDEITSLDGWELYLKRYYDQRFPFKFIVSSSSASLIIRKSRESLAGRMIRFRCTPFCFSEFLRLQEADKALLDLYSEAGELWKAFFASPDVNLLFRHLTHLSRAAAWREKEISRHLHHYLHEGGFPEFLRLSSPGLKRQYFQELIVERVVYHDLPQAFGLKDRGLLQNLLLHSVFHSGSMVNMNEIASSMGTSRQTVSEYLNYLQASMLVQLVMKYAKTEASRLRAFRKVYAVDPGLFVHLQRLSPATIEARGILGALAEMVVLSHMRLVSGENRIYYFRERENEIDFVVEAGEAVIPVEVKYRASIRDPFSLAPLKRKLKAQSGLVVTKSHLDLRDNILSVPLGLFLS